MAARRGLILAALLWACSGGSDSSGEAVAPTAGRPPNLEPPSSGASSGGSSGNGFSRPDDCPSVRTEGNPLSTLTEDEIRQTIVGMHRSCSSTQGLEIRFDEAANELRWYLLDDRFVRLPPPGFDGTLEVVSCEGSQCTVKWKEQDGTTVYQLSLWSSPTAMVFAEDATTTVQEWVRVAD